MERDGKKKKKMASLYSKGELNKLIDILCHPLFKTNEGFMLIDGFLHGLVEQNPSLSIRKFIKYNLPRLIRQVEKNNKRQGRTK